MGELIGIQVVDVDAFGAKLSPTYATLCLLLRGTLDLWMFGR
jgi:hypothetical protein